MYCTEAFLDLSNLSPDGIIRMIRNVLDGPDIYGCKGHSRDALSSVVCIYSTVLCCSRRYQKNSKMHVET